MEKKEEGQVKRWFKPGSQLSEAAGDGGPGALHAPASQTREYSVAPPDTNDVISRFNRDTEWLATLVMGAVVSAALMLAVLVQNRHPKAVDLTEEAVQAGDDLLLNANPVTHFTVVDSIGKTSTRETTSGQATSVDHAFTEISPQENPSSQMKAAGSSPAPVLAFAPEVNRQDMQANASSWIPAHWQDSGRVIGLKVPRAISMSSVRPRFVDAKMRLIALWHQSLARSERSRSWTLFSKSNTGDRKKVSYAAETNH